MKDMYTVAPFLVALIVGLAGQGLDIYQVNAWHVGTLKVEPWRQKTSGLTDRVRTALSWLTRLWSPRLALAIVVLAVLVSAQLSAAHVGVAFAMAVPAAVSDPTLSDVMAAVSASNSAFNEFKLANDERIKQIETKGHADPLLLQKIERINADIDKFSRVNDDFMQMKGVVNRLEKFNPAGDTSKDRQAKLVLFNRELRARAMEAGKPSVELTAEQFAEYDTALDKYLRSQELFETDKRALSVGNDPQGGYLVTPDRSGRMIERIYETSEMRQHASVQPIATDALEGTYDIDEASFGWVSETGSRTTNNGPNVPAPWRIPVYEAYSQPVATQKMLEDANIDVAQWLGKKVGNKFGRGFNAAFVNGNGVGKPRGFNTYTTAATADTTRAWGQLEHVATGTSASFGTDPNGVNKLLDLIHKLKDVYIRNAKFFLTRTSLGKVRQLTDNSSAGKYVFVPSFVAGMPDTLLGYPVAKMQDMDDYSTASALAIAFGDMQETYQIVDRLGVTVLVDPYTNKPYVNFYTRARVGGDVVNFESLKFLKMI